MQPSERLTRITRSSEIDAATSPMSSTRGTKRASGFGRCFCYLGKENMTHIPRISSGVANLSLVRSTRNVLSCLGCVMSANRQGRKCGTLTEDFQRVRKLELGAVDEEGPVGPTAAA